jgi:hypothetical protein
MFILKKYKQQFFNQHIFLKIMQNLSQIING